MGWGQVRAHRIPEATFRWMRPEAERGDTVGAALALRAGVPSRIVVCLLVAACRHPRATHPPIPAPCTAERVGSVELIGGSADDVPQLVVLAGTLDNPARTDRIAQVSTELLRGRGYPRA